MGAEASTPAEKAQPEDDVDIVTEDYGKARAVFAERCVISALRNRTVDTARLWAPHVCLRALPQACLRLYTRGGVATRVCALAVASRRIARACAVPRSNQVGDPQQEGCVP